MKQENSCLSTWICVFLFGSLPEAISLQAFDSFCPFNHCSLVILILQVFVKHGSCLVSNRAWLFFGIQSLVFVPPLLISCKEKWAYNLCNVGSFLYSLYFLVAVTHIIIFGKWLMAKCQGLIDEFFLKAGSLLSIDLTDKKKCWMLYST